MLVVLEALCDETLKLCYRPENTMWMINKILRGAFFASCYK